MKKLIAILLVLLVAGAFVFAGTHYIEYSCGCREAVGSTKGKDSVTKSTNQCNNCSKQNMCTDIYGKVEKDIYDKHCNWFIS